MISTEYTRFWDIMFFVNLLWLMGLYVCRLFSDDSSDSIQFLADSDEQQNDNAAADSASVWIAAGNEKEKLLTNYRYNLCNMIVHITY